MLTAKNFNLHIFSFFQKIVLTKPSSCRMVDLRQVKIKRKGGKNMINLALHFNKKFNKQNSLSSKITSGTFIHYPSVIFSSEG